RIRVPVGVFGAELSPLLRILRAWLRQTQEFAFSPAKGGDRLPAPSFPQLANVCDLRRGRCQRYLPPPEPVEGAGGERPVRRRRIRRAGGTTKGQRTPGSCRVAGGVDGASPISPRCGGESKINILAKPSVRFCKRG